MACQRDKWIDAQKYDKTNLSDRCQKNGWLDGKTEIDKCQTVVR